MTMNEDDLTMPWRGIVKLTAGFAAVVTGVSAWALRIQKQQREDDARYRWNDKNRWE